MEKKSEKRSVNRVAIRGSVSFERTEREPGRFRNVLEIGTGVDISQMGIGLSTANPLREGDVLKLNLPAAVANISLPVYTEVMWSTPANGKYRVGLRFLV
jgi:hypothetical protein